jgi:GAF domain-containing protein
MAGKGDKIVFNAIRTRLLLAFVLIGMLPLLIVGTTGTFFAWRSGRRRSFEQLELQATFSESEIDAWTDGLLADLDMALTQGDALVFARVLLMDKFTDLEGAQDIRDNLRVRFQQYLDRTSHLDELFLIDLQGREVFSTNATRRGEGHSDQAYFDVGLQASYVYPLSYSSMPNQLALIAVQPVLDERGGVIGILAGRVGVTALYEIVSRQARVGETGEMYLVGADYVMLTDLGVDGQRVVVRSEGVRAAIEGEQRRGSGLYRNYFGVPVVGVYRWLPKLGVALLAEQPQAEAFRAVYTMIMANVGTALLAALVAVIASLRVTRGIANPLADLSAAARQIAAGDLERVVRVMHKDELGAVAQAFNSMTARLRDLVASLEQRVADRTRDIERRSAYLEAVARVGRTALSILDVDRLIRIAVELIREQFDLYYVGLFLVDGDSEWAVLSAGTGAAGRAMLARGHRIRVGEGMIGWCVANAQPRIALDAGEDAVRLATAELPDTRSEVALPLHSRGRVFGALTVQSDRPSAFDQATVAVLQLMADQVAVALDNARLFDERQEALETASRAYGELSREAWQKLLSARSDMGFRCDEGGVERTGGMWRPEMERAMQEGQTVYAEPKDEDRLPLAVPIVVGGEVIGVLDTYKPGEAGTWTTEQVALLEQIAEQLSLALENARLYEDAQRLGFREQQLREIGSRMQSSFDVDVVLQMVVEDLAKALNVPSAFVQLTPSAMRVSEGE